jgi:hypothetical protein
MMPTRRTGAIDAFVSNIHQIEDLLTLDELILEIPICLLEEVVEAHDRMKIHNPQARVDRPLTLLRNIRANESLETRLQTVRNQCVVLAVSHFTSAVRWIFLEELSAALKTGDSADLLEETVTLSVGSILELTEDPTRALAV